MPKYGSGGEESGRSTKDTPVLAPDDETSSKTEDSVASFFSYGNLASILDLPAAELSPPKGGDTGKSLARGIANDSLLTGVRFSHSIVLPTSEIGSDIDTPGKTA